MNGIKNNYELPDFDEVFRRHEEGKAVKQAVIDRVYSVNNTALRALNKCGVKGQNRHDCLECGNEECLKAFREQQELWEEADKGKIASILEF